MKRIIFISILFVTVMATDVMAACTDTRRINLTSFLGNKTACKSDGNGGFEWQEYHKTPHSTADNLIDYKKGPNDPVDPTKAVGKWSLKGNGTANATVTYYYGPGVEYTYSLHSATPSGPFSFCNGPTEVVGGVKLKAGQVPC